MLLLANALTVVARPGAGGEARRGPAAGGHDGDRARWLFVAACLLVVGAAPRPEPPYAALLAAAIVVGVGECFHTTALMPLVADLAPPALRGRYMAAMGLSWWIGLALAPTLGAAAARACRRRPRSSPPRRSALAAAMSALRWNAGCPQRSGSPLARRPAAVAGGGRVTRYPGR